MHHPTIRRLSIASLLVTLASLMVGCGETSGQTGNTELNIIVPDGGTDTIDIRSVEYTINCTGGQQPGFLDDNATFPDAVRVDGNLEVVERACVGGDTPGARCTLNSDCQGTSPTPDGTCELPAGRDFDVWQGFMDLPPGDCTVQLRARNNENEVICTDDSGTITITADQTTKVNMVLICQVSFQAPVGMLDVDASFSFEVGNFCPDLIVFNAIDSDPQDAPFYVGAISGFVVLPATTLEVRFRDGDNGCGEGCDPQTCEITPEGLACTPAGGPALPSGTPAAPAAPIGATLECTSLSCTGGDNPGAPCWSDADCTGSLLTLNGTCDGTQTALIDCDGEFGLPFDTQCEVLADTNGNHLGIILPTPPSALCSDGATPCSTDADCTFPEICVTNPLMNFDAIIGCAPPGGITLPGLGTVVPPGVPGAVVTCRATVTDGDNQCDKEKRFTYVCPGLDPCDPANDPPPPDCDDGSECTVDSCDSSSGVAVCVNDPVPAGTICSDLGVCSSTPGVCDSAGVCSFTSCNDDAVCDDGNACTTNTCDLGCGVCELPVPVADGALCDVGLGPSSGECLAGACVGICAGTTCPDNGVPCITDTCSPVDGSCVPITDAGGSVCDPPGGTPGTGLCDAGVCLPSAFDGFCAMPLAFEEPLCNPTYDDTLWPGSHRGSYAQGSAAGPGPAPGAAVTPEHLELPGAPIIHSFTEPYPDGGRAIWSSVIGAAAAIVKLDHDTFQIIDDYVPAREETNPPIIPVGVSGAYTAVDASGNFIVGRTGFVSTFGDSVPGDRFSTIELKRRVFLGAPLLCNGSDTIAGMSLTYDGHIAFVSELGNVFVIPVDAEQGDVGSGVPVISTNPNCATADPATLETVSNSIATDENGGIYVVTSAAMYRFDWDGTSLSQTWRVPYDSDPNVSPIRLGAGSGQTPSLMGTRADDDRFVVIADGKQLMNLLFIWRDDIPPGWQPIAPGKDPRIACEVPIRFGDPSATAAMSEQSIGVRGYGAIVVNDLLTNPTIVDPATPQAGVAQNLISALEGGIPAKAPVGIERVDWDPVTQTCSTVWANSTVSIPNGIPSISEESRLVYGIGQRGGQFGVEALDLDTGASVLWAPGGSGACDPNLISVARVLPPVDAVLDTEIIPGSGVLVHERACENSVYAATTVGPDGSIYTGTFFGVSKYTPDVVPPPSESVQAHAGVDQALDLLDRALAALGGGGTSAARDYVGRAYVQVSGTVAPAYVTGPTAAYNEVIAAATSIQAALTAIDAAQDPTADINQAIVSLSNAAALLN
jgi:hypothetical protein